MQTYAEMDPTTAALEKEHEAVRWLCSLNHVVEPAFVITVCVFNVLPSL